VFGILFAGLNAGVIPDPGFTYANMPLNYSATRLNDSNGNRLLQNVTGTYSFWVDENIFYFVPKHKVLGGYFMPYIALDYAFGSLVADLDLASVSLSAADGRSGLADTYVQPAWRAPIRAFVEKLGKHTPRYRRGPASDSIKITSLIGLESNTSCSD
jgi:hypothetical protein